ncbi:hypothetical protein [Streptomyces sp. NRRL F-5053]|uniref:hypothetical protein n=1 Tax=Streptomyces sp. NRRL F-5053 TaxID=1463854 RepID=UPI0004C74D74|nr:hypothetical protein [Streptomyces sp. NRRL F-5053]
MFTDELQHPRATFPETTSDDDPLLRLQKEGEPDNSIRTQTTTHADPITITGITVMCPKCGARRDWLVICDRRNQIYLRCRCAHEWHEPELTRADFERIAGEGGQKYPSLEAVVRDTGYDGTLAGTYLPDGFTGGTCGRETPGSQQS